MLVPHSLTLLHETVTHEDGEEQLVQLTSQHLVDDEEELLLHFFDDFEEEDEEHEMPKSVGELSQHLELDDELDDEQKLDDIFESKKSFRENVTFLLSRSWNDFYVMCISCHS